MKLRELLTKLRFLFARKRASDLRDLDEELRFHVEQSVQAYVDEGIAAKEARRRALIDFGGVTRTREAAYEQWPGWWMETVLQDVRYALRGFRRNPVFTVTVIVTLALGIGATTAVFSVVDRILFRSLPYAHDDRIVSIGLSQSLEKQEFMLGGFFYEWRDNQKPFEAMASQSTGPTSCVLAESIPTQLNCISAQAGFLPMLGILPVLGRNFLPEEDRPNGPRVALITYGLWKSHYGLDPRILNRLITVDGSPMRVVGVLPKEFELPTLQAADVIMPLALVEAEKQRTQNGGIGQPMRAFARLKPRVSITQAKAEMEPLFIHTQETFIPAEVRKDFHLSIRSLRDRQTEDVQLVAWVLLGSVLAVLLIACANVASLMMARGAARERELAVRSALGASRGRLIRQTLTEAFLLSMVGATAGLALAQGLLMVFIAMAPTSVPFLDKAHLDLRTAGFTVLLALVSGVFFGLIPALQKPRSVALSARMTHSGRHAFLRLGMVVGQIAISMILLSGAALLLRSFQKMETQNLGVQTRGVMTARISLPGVRTEPIAGLVSKKGQTQKDIFLQVEAAVRRLPGVGAVGWSDSFPPGGGWQNSRMYSDFAVVGKSRSSERSGGLVRLRGVTPDYFRALNIPIVRGGGFTEEERGSSELFMVLSRLLASRLFPGEDPIGRRIGMGSDGTTYTVVGVAENVRNGGLSEQDIPEAYWLRRNVAEDWGVPVPVMVFDTVLAPATVSPWVRSQIAHLEPMAPIEIETLNERVSKLADRPRFETALLGFFALTGLSMAVIGLYGVTSFLATQRTQEIGVRMALGANRADILRLIVHEGARLLLLGAAIGVSASLALTQLLKSLLFDIGPRDPATLGAVTLLLAVVALAATLIPARSAMQTDPMEALRCE
ncbi:ABC transporter permease [Acidicapsa ligni]|uniref:ABC transporter permease n=1 Tax=Acidicapsa ligni TaxID=542300 RepID=UPI0021E0A121|nr:ABC transporter permease [Acidicapsa ligni]